MLLSRVHTPTMWRVAVGVSRYTRLTFLDAARVGQDTENWARWRFFWSLPMRYWFK
jgi:hypothetical protein